MERHRTGADFAAGIGTIRHTARSRWKVLTLMTLAGLVAYQLFLLSPFLASGSFPNYFKVYDAWGGIIESFQLQPPAGELWELIENQPVYEFGVRDRFGFIGIAFVATPHTLVTMAFLPPLVALLLLLLARAWPLLIAAPRAHGKVAGIAGVSTGTLASLFGASTSAVACCGASSGPAFLTLLGVGFGTAGVIVKHADLLEASGFLLLIGNILGLGWWLGRRASSGSCVLIRRPATIGRPPALR